MKRFYNIDFVFVQNKELLHMLIIGVALLLAVMSPSVAAERIPSNPRYVFHTIGSDQGYNTITPYSVIQDSNGFLWIASQSGLFRYDGSEMFLLGEEYGMPETDTQQVIEAPDGKIWATSYGKIYYFDGVSFSVLDTGMEDLAEGGKLAFGNRMAFDASGDLYVAHQDGILQFSASDSTKKKVWTSRQGVPKGPVGAVKSAPDGTILFAVEDHLGRLDAKTDKVIMLADLGVTPKESIFSIAVTSNGRISVRTLSHLMWYNPSTREFISDSEGLSQDPNEAGHFIDSLDNVWVATSDGLFFKENGRWQKVSTENGLSSNSIRAVAEDHEGALWVGLSGNGLTRWPGPTTWRAWTTESGLATNHIWCTVRDRFDRLLVGTNHGLNIWDPEKEKWSYYSIKNGLVGNAIRRMRIDNNGMIWAMTRNAGFTLIDPETLSLRAIPVPSRYKKGPLDTNVGPDGKIWVTGDGHLYTLHLEDGEPVFTDVPVPPKLADCTFTVAVSKNGVVWTSGAIGLCRYDGNNWKHFTVENNGLTQNAIEDLVVESGNVIWVNYRDNSKGVSKFTLQKDGTTSIRHVRVEDGVLEGPIFMMERGGDDIWIGGAIGITIVSPDFSVRTINHHDGLIWDDIDRAGLYEDRDGTMWVGTSGGLAHYKPTSSTENKAPNVIIASATLGGEEKLNDESPKADYEHNTFVAKFSGLTFRNPHDVRFKYRLIGLEEEFTETNLREVRYPALFPGKYTFEVLCRSSKGLWSETPAIFTFRVVPPWWMSWWAISLVVIVLGALITVLYRINVRRLRSRDREVSALAWNKTKATLDSQISALKKMIEETSSIAQDMGSMSSKMASLSSGLEGAVSGASVAIEELGRTGNQSEHNAKFIVDAASQNTEFARKGQSAVAETRSIMEDVEQDASQIVDKSTRMFNRLQEADSIINMVNSVAEQSKVLAINASIEAASAGEYGAGFGVVAKEVGTLAEQIKDLTLNVSELLTSSHVAIREVVKSAEKTQEKMEDGVRSADNSGAIVNDLSEALNNSTELAKIIKSTVAEQRTGLSLISKEIQSVFVTSSDSTAISGRVAKQAEQLNDFVKQLDDMIENWKAPDTLL